MLIIPSIDLRNERETSLKQGTIENITLSSGNPVQLAEHWIDAGARRLHLANLDDTSLGKPKNLSIIREILNRTGTDFPVQLAGGIRSLDTIEQYLDAGLQYIIIGTAAIKTPGFLHEACDAFPGHIIVALDTRGGKIAAEGWTKLSNHDATDLAKRFEDYGIEALIYKDIGQDGMLTSVNIEATVNLAQALHVPVIASGEDMNLDDIRRLCAVAKEGISSVVTRRAIYEGKLDLTAAQRLADELDNLALV